MLLDQTCDGDPCELLHIAGIPTKRQTVLSHNTQQMKSQRWVCVCVWKHLSPKLTPLHGCLSHNPTNRWFGSVTLTTFQGPVAGEELSHTSLHNYTQTHKHAVIWGVMPFLGLSKWPELLQLCFSAELTCEMFLRNTLMKYKNVVIY